MATLRHHRECTLEMGRGTEAGLQRTPSPGHLRSNLDTPNGRRTIQDRSRQLRLRNWSSPISSRPCDYNQLCTSNCWKCIVYKCQQLLGPKLYYLPAVAGPDC